VTHTFAVSPLNCSARLSRRAHQTSRRAARLAPASCSAALLLLSLSACDKAAPSGVVPRESAVTNANSQAPAAATSKRWSALGDVVVQVGRHSITSATVNHWIAVEAILTHEYDGEQPVPRGLVPDPPDYRWCIAYLAAKGGGQHESKASKAAQLKGRCEQLRKSLRQQAVSLLIVHYWVSEEAARHDLSAPTHEVRRATRRIYRTEPRRGLLAAAGVRPSDERLVVEDHLLRDKLQRRLPIFDVLRRTVGPEPKQTVVQIELAVQKLTDEMTRRWTPRTHCRSGYVVSECSEYLVAGRR
jgi:hypothetical protein